MTSEIIIADTSDWISKKMNVCFVNALVSCFVPPVMVQAS